MFGNEGPTRPSNAPFTASPQWMAAAFAQAGAVSGTQAQGPEVPDAVWPWLLGLLHHDSLASVHAYRAVVSSLLHRYDGAGLQRKLRAIASATCLAMLARETAPLSGWHPALRRGAIAIHTSNCFSRDFLPPSPMQAAPAGKACFALRQAGAHTPNVAARITSYLILLTIHPYRDGNGRTARLLFAADTLSAGDSPADLLGLVWLHGQRGARFHLAAKCARAGDFDMLFALYAESKAQALQQLRAPIDALSAALCAGDEVEADAAAQALHGLAATHVQTG